MRLVADLVRGKNAQVALSALMFLPKRAAEPMEKLLRSALANARAKGFAPSGLVISKIEVNQGIVFKRFMPRARGKAAPIRKKTSHITLELSEVKQKAKKAAPAQK